MSDMIRHPSPTVETDTAPDHNCPKDSIDGRSPPRQACIECRRRKIECDGFRKSGCKTCKSAGVECISPENKRGRLKGSLETISNRLSRIERILLDATEKQRNDKREDRSDEEYAPERKRRRSKQHPRRPSHQRSLPPMAALLAPNSSIASDIPFHTYRPRISISFVPSPPLPPKESALDVLAHELEPMTSGMIEDYFGNTNVLPVDLAESLVNIYFDNVHPVFPIVHKNSFLTSFHRTLDKSGPPDYLAWAVFLAASFYSDDPRLEFDGLHPRTQIEEQLKFACQRDLERGKSTDLSLIQSIILGQLFSTKREMKMTLLSWVMNGRAVRLAMNRQVNINPRRLGFDPETSTARILMWWCMYIVNIWNDAGRGCPPSIHEGEFDVPLPTISDPNSNEETFFIGLVSLTRILSKVLSFGVNTSRTLSTIDISTEESIRDLRIQLSDWYRTKTGPRVTSSLHQHLLVAYLTVVILLHRPLLPNPPATKVSDPILLLVSGCASSIVQIAQYIGVSDVGSIPWRLFVPAVGYLTAGVTLAHNATWPVHIPGASGLGLSAREDVKKLLEVFDQVELNGHYIADMNALLQKIFKETTVELVVSPRREIQGIALPLPHEDPSFSTAQTMFRMK